MSKFVLFVDEANRCRSVLAEYRLQEMLSKRKDMLAQEVEVASAGIGYSPESIDWLKAQGKHYDKPSAKFGLPPYPYAIESMKWRGLDISKSRSKELTQAMVERANLIIAFEDSQKEKVYPRAQGKVFTLQEFVGYTGYLLNIDWSVPIPWVLDPETKDWIFPDSYLEGTVTEIEHMLWWGIDRFIDFLSV